jgi:uncharacterized protein (TIGR03435 family)
VKQHLLATAGIALLVGVLNPPRPQARSPTTGGDSPTFEVASVKPHEPGDQRVMMVAQPGGRFVASNITLRFLIRTAYRVQDDQIVGGPGWVNADGFDIVAKADPTAPLEQYAAMLRALLVGRFELATHVEMRERPVYALVFARSDRTLGARLRPTACPSPDQDVRQSQPCATIRTGLGQLNLRGAPLAQILQFLAPYVNRVLVDRTGLSGRYDLDLEWTPEQLAPRPAGAPESSPIDPNGPSIYTAVQEQLGLKLESQKGPVDVVVIDRVERPTED